MIFCDWLACIDKEGFVLILYINKYALLSCLADMSKIATRAIHYLHKLNAANIPTDLLENGQKRVIEASLTLIRERAKLKVNVDFLNIILYSSSL